MRPTTSRLLAVCIVVCATLLCAQVISAAPTTGRALLNRAKEAYLEARVEASIRLLRKAAARAGDDQRLAAQIQLYVALNQLVAGRQAAAEKALQRALTHDPNLRLDADRFKPSTIALLERVRQGLRGTLAVTANLPGSVWIDGKDAGKTPLTLKIPIGYHQVEVRAGSARHSQRVLISAGQEARVTAKLTTKERPVATPVVQPPPTAAPIVKRPGPQVDQERGARLWTYVVAGTAAAALGVAIGLGVSAESDHAEYQATLDYDRFESLEQSIRTRTTAANVLYISAGALAAGAVVLFFLEGRSYGASDSAARVDSTYRVRTSVTPTDFSVAFDLTF